MGFFRLGKSGSLDFGQSVVDFRNCGYFPLILCLAHILQLSTVAYFDVCNDSFALFALSVLVADTMFVEALELFRVGDNFPLRVLVLLSCSDSCDGWFSFFTKSDN